VRCEGGDCRDLMGISRVVGGCFGDLLGNGNLGFEALEVDGEDDEDDDGEEKSCIFSFSFSFFLGGGCFFSFFFLSPPLVMSVTDRITVYGVRLLVN